MVQQTGVANGPDGSPAIMFRCTGTQGMLSIASVSVVGVKSADAGSLAASGGGGSGSASATPGVGDAPARGAAAGAARRLGYVMTFATLAADDALARYEGLARHMFASLRLV